MAGPTPADVMSAHLEPEAVAGCGIREDTVLTASIAISLKRIADHMIRPQLADDVIAGMAGNRAAKAIGAAITEAFTAPINHFGEGIGTALQGQIIRGNAGDDRI